MLEVPTASLSLLQLLLLAAAPLVLLACASAHHLESRPR